MSDSSARPDFVQTSTVIAAHPDARLRILLGWRMRVNVRTPLRVGAYGALEVVGKSSVSVDELPPRWWTWLMEKLPKVNMPEGRAAVGGRAARV
jgi:hypothetical protein